MSAHTHYEGLASILNYLPTVVHCNFDQHLRSNYPDILQVALVGIYAIYFHAYARTPSLAEAKDDDAIQLILWRLRYPTFTIVSHASLTRLRCYLTSYILMCSPFTSKSLKHPWTRWFLVENDSCKIFVFNYYD